jgi:uncharacterized membrane protein (DUF2068 family)
MAQETTQSPISILHSRPASVTLLALGVLIISGINLLRFVQAIRQWDFLSEMLSISPFYLAATGLFWGSLWLVAAWGLWRGRRWAPSLTIIASLAYTLYYWLDRLLLASDSPGINWPFTTALNAALLFLTAWILTRSKAKAFFQRKR